jgi:hypothetical protein
MDFLCQDEDEAEAFIANHNLSISAQELLAYHTLLRDVRGEYKYGFTIVDRSQRRLTVYVNQKAHDKIYHGLSYGLLDRLYLTKYIQTTARGVISGIWVSEGHTKVTLRIGRFERQHVNFPRTWPDKREEQ